MPAPTARATRTSRAARSCRPRGTRTSTERRRPATRQRPPCSAQLESVREVGAFLLMASAQRRCTSRAMSFRTLRCPGGLSRSLDCLCSPCACSSPGRLVHTPPPCVSYPKSSRRTPLLLRPLALPAAIALHHVPHCARRLVSPLLNPRLNLYGLEGSFTGNPFLKRRHAAFAFWRTRHERERDCFVGGRESVVHERPSCLGAYYMAGREGGRK